jgi:uncharacterized Fe-S cluster protein YjdI
MYCYKQFLSKEVIISPLKFNKKQTLSGQNILDKGIRFVYGENNDDNFRSIEHLYNTYFIAGSYTEYNPYVESNYLSEILISRDLLGEKLHNKTLKIKYGGVTIIDDGDGNLYDETDETTMLGVVMYNVGLIILYDNNLSEDIENKISGLELEFYSTITIYEHQYHCVIGPNEFKTTQNPSIINPDNTLPEYAFEKYFSPYITTVGLYNDNKDLLAVAKLSKPLPSSKYLDTNIIIKFDE